MTDFSPEHDLRNALAELSPLIENGTVTCRLGSHEASDFTSCDLVIANPAVPTPWKNPYLTAATEAGVPITTEIRLVTEGLASKIDRSRVIGVTGSAGKSTTASMIHHILSSQRLASHLGGNIGGSLLGELDRISADDFVVLELSSAMLYWLDAGVGWDDAPGWSPGVGVLTNVQPNHIDWHGSFEHYASCKQLIFAHQRDGDHRITSEEYEARRPLPLKVPGKHNQVNGFLAVSACLRAANVFPPQSVAALASFETLAHRLETVHCDARGRVFVNDSKSTTPDATLLAIDAHKRPSMVHLIAGGYDKGSDLSAIGAAASRLGGLYCIGATGSSIASGSSAPEQTFDCATLESAVETALGRMDDEHVLLLSPGCASWDQFTHYEARGDAFRDLVRSATADQT